MTWAAEASAVSASPVLVAYESTTLVGAPSCSTGSGAERIVDRRDRLELVTDHFYVATGEQRAVRSRHHDGDGLADEAHGAIEDPEVADLGSERRIASKSWHAGSNDPIDGNPAAKADSTISTSGRASAAVASTDDHPSVGHGTPDEAGVEQLWEHEIVDVTARPGRLGSAVEPRHPAPDEAQPAGVEVWIRSRRPARSARPSRRRSCRSPCSGRCCRRSHRRPRHASAQACRSAGG